MGNKLTVEHITTKGIEVSCGDGPSVCIQAHGSLVGMWFVDAKDQGQDSPSLGIVMERGKPPYLAFRTSDREHLPAAITFDPKTGQLVFQEPRK